jgi:hypothetical protein
MKSFLPIVVSAAFLTACGGGGSSSSSGAVSGLNMPKTMSVVTSSDTGNRSSRGEFSEQARAGSHYETDSANVYVYDESMQALDTVNMILCLMDQTAATSMVNTGGYLALIDEDKCEQGQNQSSSGTQGQSAGGTVTTYNTWTVNSTRATSTSPQIVQMWVPGDAGDPQIILPEMTASEGVSSSRPFGSFVMNFKGVLDANDDGVADSTKMKGTLRTLDNAQSKPQFSFFNIGGDALTGGSSGFSFEESANVILDDATGTSGQALTRFVRGAQETKFAVAFDQNFLYRGKDTDGDNIIDATQCLSRTLFDSQVWRYNVYHAADGTWNGQSVTEEQRVSLNSGFSFTYASGNESMHGWLGYYGLWVEGDTNIPDASTISKYNYSTETSTDYTVRRSGGKLVRRTANTIDLTKLQGLTLSFWGEHPDYSGAYGQWQISVDGGNDFQITGRTTWGDSGPAVATTFDHDNNSGTGEVAVAHTFALANNQWLGLWSESLGGSLQYVHDTGVAAGNRQATYYAQQFVNPDDAVFNSGSLTLYCYDRCLTGSLSQNDIDTDSTTYNSGIEYAYTVSSTNGKIQIVDDLTTTVVDASALDLSSSNNQWGLSSGEMLTTQLANPANFWETYDAAVTYFWETGPNAWNRLTTVTDASDVVATFDRPVQFTYQHATANDANGDATHDGATFLLQYEGEGNLHGFPWEEDSTTGRWYSAITLKDGTQLTDGSNNFKLKAMESEQTMQQVNESDCTNAGLVISGLFGNTDLALPELADLSEVSHTLAEQPTVTDAPAVIDGEVQ